MMRNEKSIERLLGKLVHYLPDSPARIWSPDGDEILCENEQLTEDIADFLDALYGGVQTVNTGFYDPVEDERNGETDQRTGWYYVTIN